jgi:hypothetical protein
LEQGREEELEQGRSSRRQGRLQGGPVRMARHTHFIGKIVPPFIKAVDYTTKWGVYTSPHTPAVIGGKMAVYETKAEAERALAVLVAR